MIVVDTSAWIAADRSGGQHGETLRELLKADEVVIALPVRLELRAGVPGNKRAAFLKALSALPVARPTDETWTQVERWADQAAEKGEHFHTADLLIAALAAELGALVWSLDKDFERMEKLKFVRLL
ncbi:MAG: PIN domain-containing protein [Vicinamibacterales bacterium]